jgi:hypothetical protein
MASDGRSQSAARPSAGQAPVRAAEVIGAMSIATDLGAGDRRRGAAAAVDDRR